MKILLYLALDSSEQEVPTVLPESTGGHNLKFPVPSPLKRLIENHICVVPPETKYLFFSADSSDKYTPLKIEKLDEVISNSAELLREKISLASVGRSAGIYLTAHGSLDDELMVLIRGYVPRILGAQGHYINFSSAFLAKSYGSAYKLIWERLKQKSRRITEFLNYYTENLTADLKLEDFILFLRQYVTANAARAYRSVARAFHKFLKEELKLPVSEINWDSPLLQFSGGYGKRELITENEFKELLGNAGRSSLLGESQMQIVLLLLCRTGLRCGEVARLTVGNFSLGFEELGLKVRFSKSDAGKTSPRTACQSAKLTRKSNKFVDFINNLPS